MAGGLLIAIAPSKSVVDELGDDDDDTLLEELHPVDGDRAGWTLSEDRWANLTVIDYQGQEKDREYLTEFSRLVGYGEDGPEYRRGYEVDCYWPEENVALASYMAGASNADLRRFERAVFLVKEKLSVEADESLEEIVSAPEARRQAAGSAVNAVIQSAEGVEAPGEGHSITEELGELRQEAEDSVDDLLSDRGLGDLEKRLNKGASEKDAESVAIAIDDTGESEPDEPEGKTDG